MKIRKAHQKDYMGNINFVKIINILKHFRNIRAKVYRINYLQKDIVITGYKKDNKILALHFFNTLNTWAIHVDVYQSDTKNIFVKHFYITTISDKEYEILSVRYATNQ